MMARYIDADLLKNEILSNAVRLNHPEDLCRETTILLIGVAPTSDVREVRHGEWILDKKITSPIFLNCSLCGNTADKDIHGNYIGITPYCSMCGAKMDGGSAE